MGAKSTASMMRIIAFGAMSLFLILLCATTLASSQSNNSIAVQANALLTFKAGLIIVGGSVDQTFQSWNTNNDLCTTWEYVWCNFAATTVTQLDVSNLQIQGKIPSDLALLSDIVEMLMNTNILTGTIPSELGLLTNLVQLTLSENSLTGPIPSELGRLSLLEIGLLYTNLLSGLVPTQLYSITGINQLVLYDNQLSGQVTSYIGQLQNVIYFSVRNNKMTGTLPTEMGMLSSITMCRLGNNMLHGSLPSELGTMLAIQVFHVYINQLTGTIPTEFGRLTSLSELMLYSNSFFGTLPTQMGNYPSFRTFYAQDNNFTGGLPTQWDDLPSLKFMDITTSGLNCSLPVLCRLFYLATISAANQLRMNLQPQRLNYNIIGSQFDKFALETWCYLLPLCNNIAVASVKVTATVQPSNQVKPGSLTGNVVISENELATFDAFNFLGKPNVTYTIIFSGAGMIGDLVSNPIIVPYCPTRLLYSIQDPLDEYSCICGVDYYWNGDEKACYPCPFGYKKTNTSAANDEREIEACIETTCAAGYWKNVTTGSCQSCNANEDSAPGSTSPNDCLCVRDFVKLPPASGDSSHGPTAKNLQCQPCYVGLVCSGDNEIKVLPGYWRYDSSSPPALCPPNGVDACASSGDYAAVDSPETYGDSLCKSGSTGPFCQICVEGYFHESTSCHKCHRIMPAGLYVFFLWIVLTLLTILFIYISSRSRTKRGPGRDINVNVDDLAGRVNTPTATATKSLDIRPVVKLLINYWQVAYYIGQFSVKWNSVVLNFVGFVGTSSFSSLSSQPECYFGNAFSFDVTLIIVYFAPIWLTSYLALGYLLRHFLLQKKDVARSLHAFQLGVMQLLYIVHPTLFYRVLQSFYCQRIPGLNEERLTADMTVRCDTVSYGTFFVISSLFVVFYIFGMVGLVLWRLVHNARSGKLFQPNHPTFQKYSFFLIGYKPAHFYWELVVMSRKLIVVAFTLLTRNGTIQLIWCQMLLVANIFANVMLKPFEDPVTNSLDTISLSVLLLDVVIAFHVVAFGEENPAASYLFIIITIGWAIILAGFCLVRVQRYLLTQVAWLKEIFEKINLPTTANLIPRWQATSFSFSRNSRAIMMPMVASSSSSSDASKQHTDALLSPEDRQDANYYIDADDNDL